MTGTGETGRRVISSDAVERGNPFVFVINKEIPIRRRERMTYDDALVPYATEARANSRAVRKSRRTHAPSVVIIVS